MSMKITADHYRRLDEHESPNAAIMLTPTGWQVATTDPVNANWIVAADKEVLTEYRKYITEGGPIPDETYQTMAEDDCFLEIGNEIDQFGLDPVTSDTVVITAQGFDGDLDIDYAWYTDLSGLKKVCESSTIGTYQGWCDEEYEVTTQWTLYRTETGRWLARFDSETMQSYWVEPTADEVTGFIRDNIERMAEDAPDVAVTIAAIYEAIKEDSYSNDVAGYRDLALIASALKGPIPAHVATLRSINLKSTIEWFGSLPAVARAIRIEESDVKCIIERY